jgi:hypothetical protein
VPAGPDRRLVEQPLGGRVVQRINGERPNVRQQLDGVTATSQRSGARCEDHRDAIAPEATLSEGETRPGLLVDPLRIVDQDRTGCSSAKVARSSTTAAATRNRLGT